MLLLSIAAQLLGGYVFATASEWFWHRYLFHGRGLRRGRMASFHWHQHHPKVRRNGGIDASFDTWEFGRADGLSPKNGRITEILGILALGILYSPAALLVPWFYGAVVVHGAVYHYIHRRCHLEPEWCQRYFPWHWEHHMGRNPHTNWCVTSEWFDKLLGTRTLASQTEAAPAKELT